MTRPKRQPTLSDREVGNLLIDFASWLSAQPGTLRIGARHEVVPLVECLQRWAELRGVDLGQALAMQLSSKLGAGE